MRRPRRPRRRTPRPRERRARYDREYRPSEPIPDPWGGLYPPVAWGGGAISGLEGGGPSPFELYGLSPYDEAYDTRRAPGAALRRPPAESRSFGRHGDAALRRWAREHGYDAGYAIRPRTGGRRYRWRGRRGPGGPTRRRRT
ncbi:MAG TPA: hypothetical protein VF212_06195 [Longimicrobiales bacterium]